MPSLFARRRESSAVAVSRLIRQLLDNVRDGLGARPRRTPTTGPTAKGRRTLDGFARDDKALTFVASLDCGALTTFTAVSAELARRIEAYAAAS
jgi:hypothetical protein